MNSALNLFHVGSAVLLLAPLASAQEDPAAAKIAAPSAPEFRALQQAVEAQTKQIEALRQAITQLTQRLPAKDSPAPPPPTVTLAPSDSAGPPANPPPAATPSHAEAAHAEPAAAPPDGAQHTVAKGETLTSIAKHYKIGIADLQNANKITDDRKLQIGQVLTIPSPKPSEPAPKKETP
jgi:LysM repeat protein